MAVRIKTIPNEILNANIHERRGAHRPAARASDAAGQVNKILELEWEALGRKLNKHTGSSADLEKLRRQLREKDEQLRRANDTIATLKKQLFSLQEKRRLQKVQATKKNVGQMEKPKPQFHGGSQKKQH